jgi:tripartite-type tricarboxylate transporter receptor subunit TctC
MKRQRHFSAQHCFRMLGPFFALLQLHTASVCAANATYPTKTVRFIVPTQSGGPSDMLARSLAQKLTQMWMQSVVVDNRGGAGGTIGTDIVAKSAADGHTLLLASNAALINMSLYTHLPYNFATDFAPIAQIGETPFVLSVHSAVAVNSVQELVALGKSKPRRLSYGSAGTGVASHLAGAMFASRAGFDAVHVPYKGQGPATTALIGGEVNFMFANPINVLPLLAAGRVRGLAVSGSRRFPGLSAVPTVAESGYPGFDVSVWFSVVCAAATPKAVVEQVNRDIVQILKMPEVRSQLEAQGVQIIANTNPEFARVIQMEIVKWAEAVKVSGARAD